MCVSPVIQMTESNKFSVLAVECALIDKVLRKDKSLAGD